MLKKLYRKKVYILVLSFVIFSGFKFLPIVFLLSTKLSETERVEANVLVVEGWLPNYALKMAYEEFKKNGYDRIVTTGIKTTSEYFNEYTNGYLIFYTLLKFRNDSSIAKHTIEIKAYSSLNGKNMAIFNVLFNDSIVGNFYADKRKKSYIINWEGCLSSIDSVSIQFMNDKVGDFGDRNLFVKEIVFDNNISISYQLNSVYSYSEPDRIIIIRNNYNSYAQMAEKNLLAMGVDSSLIVEITGKKVAINRTLTSALAFREWQEKSGIDIKGINIVTLGTHAQRTWLTYNKILNKKYKIGIISLPDYRTNYSRRYQVFKTLRETIGIIWYWIILLPY